jgi:hypothetical protein
MENKKISDSKRKKSLRVVILLNFLQALGRLFFAVFGLRGGIDQFLDVPVSHTTSLILHAMFFLLGASGLVAAYGLLRRWTWGFWAVVSVSVITIIFDTWGFTIQKTAAAGFVVPIISLGYLYLKRSHILADTT